MAIRIPEYEETIDNARTTLAAVFYNGMLEGEMIRHLAIENSGVTEASARNRRSGATIKHVRGLGRETVVLNIPRDRRASFNPIIIPKSSRSAKSLGDIPFPVMAGIWPTRTLTDAAYGPSIDIGVRADVAVHLMRVIEIWNRRLLRMHYAALRVDAVTVGLGDRQKVIGVVTGVTEEGDTDLLVCKPLGDSPIDFEIPVFDDLRRRGVKSDDLVAGPGTSLRVRGLKHAFERFMMSDM